MAEGTPLERVQVVNSGARVQIPPSPLERHYMLFRLLLKRKESAKNIKSDLSHNNSKKVEKSA